MRRYHTCGLILALLVTAVAGAARAEESAETSPKETETFASRILTLTDLVLEKHIDPPARQQMILGGVKMLHRAAKQPIPSGLSTRVSRLASVDQITSYLDEIAAEFKELEHTERRFTNGMLQTVPGGAFLVDADSSRVRAQFGANRYVGTGIVLSMHRDLKRPQMSKVFYNGPAWRSGARTRDVIFEINGKSTENKDLRKIVEELRGEEGSDVTMELKQPDAEESRTLTITRGRVFIPTVVGVREKDEGQWQFTIESASDIALLRIKSIGPSTLHELRQAATKLREKNIRGVILDLRESGGILHDTVMVADSLLDGGNIGSVRSQDSVTKHEARPGALFDGLPMAVLTIKHMGPGSTYLTAALQDNERAVVVGEATAIVPYVSVMLPVPGRSEQLRLATGVLLRGDGTPLLATSTSSRAIPRVDVETLTKKKRRPGFIVPDHVVPARARLGGKGSTTDSMIAKAIEVLQNAANEKFAAPTNEKASG